MHSFIAFAFFFVLIVSQAFSSPAGSKRKMRDEVVSQTVPLKKVAKFKESSDATTTKQHFFPFARESRRKADQRYRSQFTNEAIERMSKELKGKELTDYLERAKNYRSRNQAGSYKARKKRMLKRKDAKLAKNLEDEEAAKEKKEQLAAANKAALSQI